jgi:phage protein D
MIKYNQDGIYFKITSPNLKTEINEKDFLSLSITEEQGKLTIGSIVLLDDGAYYSAIKRGAILSMEWGYSFVSGISNMFRKGLDVMVISPSCNLAEKTTTTINFRSGFSMITNRKSQNYNDTKLNVVTLVMASAGIKAPLIDFSNSNEKGMFRQDSETDFQFLRRLAIEWKKQFILGYDPKGQPTAIFSDYNSTKAEQYLQLITGQLQTSNLFEYNSGIRNVIKADIEENFSESGAGEQIQFVLIDGQAVKQSVQAEQKTVQYLKFDSDKMRLEADQIAKRQGRQATLNFLSDIMSATDFQADNVKRFWTPVDYKTAMPHSGTKINITAFGNPLITVPSPVVLGAGFPSAVANAKGPGLDNGYKIRKVTHTINSSGYFNEIEVRNYLNL